MVPSSNGEDADSGLLGFEGNDPSSRDCHLSLPYGDAGSIPAGTSLIIRTAGCPRFAPLLCALTWEVPRLRSGFRQRAQTPANRLNFWVAQRSRNLRANSSFAPSGLSHILLIPGAYAPGCILTPLRG